MSVDFLLLLAVLAFLVGTVCVIVALVTVVRIARNPDDKAERRGRLALACVVALAGSVLALVWSFSSFIELLATRK